jgi:hypothetical protein
MLQSFTAVLDEPGVSYARARNAALCAGEGVIRVRLLSITPFQTQFLIVISLNVLKGRSSSLRVLSQRNRRYHLFYPNIGHIILLKISRYSSRLSPLKFARYTRRNTRGTSLSHLNNNSVLLTLCALKAP